VKIVIYTHSFAPQVGGVETVVFSLAHSLAHIPPTGATSPPEAILVTPTPAREMDDTALAFRVVRKPTAGELVRLLWAANLQAVGMARVRRSEAMPWRMGRSRSFHFQEVIWLASPK
jgi:hypothetical protein